MTLRINYKERLSNNESCNPMSSEELAPAPKLYQEYLRRWYFQDQYVRHNAENNPSITPSVAAPLSSLFPYGDDVMIVVPTKKKTPVVPVTTTETSMPSNMKAVVHNNRAYYPDYTKSSRALVTPKAA